jgi:hypothetical protein
MSATEILKTKLHTFIENISDENILKAHAVLLQKEIEQQTNDWNDLPEALKLALQESETDFENGNFEPVEDVLNRLKKNGI